MNILPVTQTLLTRNHLEFAAWSVKWLSKYLGKSAASCVKVELSTNSGRMHRIHPQKSIFGQVEFSHVDLQKVIIPNLTFKIGSGQSAPPKMIAGSLGSYQVFGGKVDST